MKVQDKMEMERRSYVKKGTRGVVIIFEIYQMYLMKAASYKSVHLQRYSLPHKVSNIAN